MGSREQPADNERELESPLDRERAGHLRRPVRVDRDRAHDPRADDYADAVGDQGDGRANRVPERADWARLSGRWTRRIDERIAALERLKAGLTQCIGCGCLSLDTCQLSNPGDRAGRRGPGPRSWVETARRK